jgi:hypothetical protein
MPQEDHPITLDEFNEATEGFYQLMHDGIALKLDVLERLLERQNKLLDELLQAIQAQG